eukprot:1702425-Prymnesium_polylepis.1
MSTFTAAGAAAAAAACHIGRSGPAEAGGRPAGRVAGQLEVVRRDQQLAEQLSLTAILPVNRQRDLTLVGPTHTLACDGVGQPGVCCGIDRALPHLLRDGALDSADGRLLQQSFGDHVGLRSSERQRGHNVSEARRESRSGACGRSRGRRGTIT